MGRSLAYTKSVNVSLDDLILVLAVSLVQHFGQGAEGHEGALVLGDGELGEDPASPFFLFLSSQPPRISSLLTKMMSSATRIPTSRGSKSTPRFASLKGVGARKESLTAKTKTKGTMDILVTFQPDQEQSLGHGR